MKLEDVLKDVSRDLDAFRKEHNVMEQGDFTAKIFCYEQSVLMQVQYHPPIAGERISRFYRYGLK